MKRENNMSQQDPNLDAKLTTSAQRQVADTVRALPEETVSLAWRSALNERLAPIAAKKVRVRRVGWLWKPTAGLAMAGALAVAVMFRIAPSPTISSVSVSSGVEANLVAFHQQSEVAYDVAGPGLANPDAIEKTTGKNTEPNWTEDDLSSL